MRKRRYLKPKLSVHEGSEFETKFDEAVNQLQLRCTAEKIAHSKSTAKTSKGEFDRRIHLTNKDWCNELKTFDGDRFYFPSIGKQTKPGIEKHQVRCLREAKKKGNEAGVFIEHRKQNKLIYIDIVDFQRMWSDLYPAKSFKIWQAMVYGEIVDDLKKFIENKTRHMV